MRSLSGVPEWTGREDRLRDLSTDGSHLAGQPETETLEPERGEKVKTKR